MVYIKEIKSVKITPFTLMSSSITAILSLIAAILTFIVLGSIATTAPEAKGLEAFITSAGAALIIIYPVSAFFINLATSFFSTLIYNALVPKLGGIKLGLEDNEVTEIPVISFSLILASIEALWAFITGLFLTALIIPAIAGLSQATPVISQAIANTTNTTGAAIPTSAALGTGGTVLAILLIIGLPIMVFVLGFISNALAAIFYNYIATRVSKIQLNFAAVAGNLYELKSIPVKPAALSVAIVLAVFGFIVGLVDLVNLSASGDISAGFGSLLGNTVGYFVVYIVITALIARLYNFLAPRIGTIKLKLE